MPLQIGSGRLCIFISIRKRHVRNILKYIIIKLKECNLKRIVLVNGGNLTWFVCSGQNLSGSQINLLSTRTAPSAFRVVCKGPNVQLTKQADILPTYRSAFQSSEKRSTNTAPYARVDFGLEAVSRNPLGVGEAAAAVQLAERTKFPSDVFLSYLHQILSKR